MTTADEALFSSTEIPGLLPELLLPRGFGSGSTAQVIDGIPVWLSGDADEDVPDAVFVHTHREGRALEVAARLLAEHGADYDRLEITGSGWCLLVTECGCTPEKHAAHEAAWDEGAELCAGCKHPQMPPCCPDSEYRWTIEESWIGADGALPYLQLVLS